MLEQDLKELIIKIQSHKCEMQNIEVKKAFDGTPKKLYDTLSSFSNQHGGGIIIFGLDEKNDFEATGVYDVQDIQVQVTNRALEMEPIIRPTFTVANYNGKNIVSAEIPECATYDKPCFYRPAGRLRGSFIRVGESDRNMTEYEIYSFEVFRENKHDELRVVDRASISDFDEGISTEYFSRLRRVKPKLAKRKRGDILSLEGITVNGKPTIGGLMLLSDYPQAYFPQLGITAMVIDGVKMGDVSETGARFIDNKRIEGCISEMADEALSFVRRNMRVLTKIDEFGKRHDIDEYPTIAVREIILNALIHRDYSKFTENSPITIRLYKDRLEVTNPGGLYGRITIEDLGKIPADTRNPYLANNLEVMLDTENRFSGIPTIYAEMKRAGLNPPVFESYRGNFSVTLYNERKTFNPDMPENKKREHILEFLKTPRSRAEIASELGISSYYAIKQYIQPLINEGIVKLTIPDKPRSKGQKYYIDN